ncbi:MAG: AAA family ATPase [Pyrinomonadaceae bacterium]
MDEDRYDSAEGWEPPDPYKKLREKARREAEKRPPLGASMLDVRPASQWITPPSVQKPRAELYGPLWREGDVCLMFGPKGVGKSLFAVQLAEDIATGKRSLTALSEPGAIATGFLSNSKAQSPKTKAQKPTVLLIDLEHTTEQFTERYTFPSPIPGNLPCRTRFHFKRASIGELDEIPKCFKDNVHEYLQHSIAQAIYTSDAKVVLIDSINYMFRGRTNAAAMAGVLKSLKLYARLNNVSILATAQTNGPRTASSARSNIENLNPLTRYTQELQLASLADTAFILAPSTYGPEYRYTKLLATRTQVPNNLAPTSPEVLTYQIEPSPNSKFDIRNSSFKYLGPSNERDHHRNYAAEALEADRDHDRLIKKLARRSSKQAIVEGILNGNFGKYLNS